MVIRRERNDLGKIPGKVSESERRSQRKKVGLSCGSLEMTRWEKALPPL